MDRSTRRVLTGLLVGGALLVCACCACWALAYALSPFPLQSIPPVPQATSPLSTTAPSSPHPTTTAVSSPRPATQASPTPLPVTPAPEHTRGAPPTASPTPTVPPAASPTPTAPPEQPRTGFTAPNFTLETLDGGSITLSALRGRPVILNFWTTWCPPCREEMPFLQQAYLDFQTQGLVVLAVNLTDQDSPEEVRDFVTRYHLTFPIALDRRGDVSRKYRITGLPTSFLVGSDGVIRQVVVGGFMNEAQVRDAVSDILP